MSKPKLRAVSRVPHSDGWENSKTGLGEFARDKSMHTAFYTDRITQEAAEALWQGDDMAARAIEKVPAEMFREGFEIVVEGDKALSEKMNKRARELKLLETARRTIEYRRAYGGAGILPGVNDGGLKLDRPLVPESIYSLDYLNVFTPRELQPWKYYAEAYGPNAGQIAQYKLAPLWQPPEAARSEMETVDASRIIRSEGVMTSTRQMLTYGRGWGDSILTRLLRIISNFQQAWQGAGILLQDFAPATLQVEGLSRLLADSQPGDQSLATRAAAIEMCRSIARLVIIDSKETFKREAVPLTGFAEALDKLAIRMAAAMDMPVSLLMGQSPAGMNATGETELRWFMQQIKALQVRDALPILEPIVKLMFRDKVHGGPGKEPENWSIKFNPLQQMTELETATLRKAVADTDKIYIDAGVLLPEQVAEQRFGGDEYSMETQVDMAEWHKLTDEAAVEEQARMELEAETAAAKPGEETAPGEEK